MKGLLNREIGAVLLVSGTTIGAGMLALPVMTAFMGFFLSLVVFAFCWVFMLATSFFLLDTALTFKGETNMISMAGKTLGLWGKVVAWITYLLLLYSLVAAYVAGSAPLFSLAAKWIFNFEIPENFTPLLLPLLFGVFIYAGTLGVDIINRILMAGLIFSYLLMVVFIPSHMQSNLLMHFDAAPIVFAIPVIITSFGYHIIIPSLAQYLNHDRKRLKQSLVIGSIIPLFIYFLWQLLILGSVPIEGDQGLFSAWQKGVSATEPLAHWIHQPWISTLARFFSFFAIVTSFLGVSLSLADFLSDGLKINKKRWEGKLLACFLTFLPPIAFIYYFPRGFILALEYAGAFVAILLGFLPAAMVWRLQSPKIYQKPAMKWVLVAIMGISIFIVVIDVLAQWGYFRQFLTKY